MKKIFSFAAIIALLVSCNGKNDPAVIDNLPQQENAGKLVFTSGQPQVSSLKVNSINHYANGTYEADAWIVNPARTKGSAETKTVGRFVASDGVYQYEGGGLDGCSLTWKSGGVIEFTNKDKVTSTGNGNFNPFTPPTNPTEIALVGAHWKLSSIVGKISGKDIKISYNDQRGINPNDVENVAKDINAIAEKELIPMKDVQGYYIKAISLNLNPNKIIVEFTAKDPYEGNWTPDLKGNAFSYQLNAKLDNELFSADAQGTYELANNNNTLILTMTAKNESGLANIVITCKKIQ